MNITYWSDYACPYCYIGETRLLQAIERLGLQDKIHLHMKAFQLDPDAPKHANTNTVERFAEKYGISVKDAAENVDNISKLGEELGIEFNYAASKFTNTMDAHRLTKFAQSLGDEKAVQELIHRLFAAYFTDNEELSDRKVLLDAAEASGLPVEAAKETLETDAFRDDVIKDEYEARLIGVRGVPYFILNDQFAIPGAVSTEDMMDAITSVLRRREKDAVEDAEGGACGTDGCALR